MAYYCTDLGRENSCDIILSSVHEQTGVGVGDSNMRDDDNDDDARENGLEQAGDTAMTDLLPCKVASDHWSPHIEGKEGACVYTTAFMV